ncbi:MAG: hypothetical protein PHS59_00070 [Paludibacter sp.]|nr:hypothetical protein [Paludibacter sp.]
MHLLKPVSILGNLRRITYATSDAAMQAHITSLGYSVTATSQAATVGTGYTVHVLSNSLGSGDAPFGTLKTTPEPVVMLKTWGLKAAALGWTTQNPAGANFTSLNVDVTTAGSTHDITKGLGTSVALFTAYGMSSDGINLSTSGVEVVLPAAQAEFPSTGVTVLATASGNTAATAPVALENAPVIIAFEKGATLNGVTLTNRAVIIGINMDSWPNLTDAAKTIITRAIAWVIDGTSGFSTVLAASLLNKVGNELVNPTNLEVEVYNTLGARVISSKETSIPVTGLANGVYVAKTTKGYLKFVL